MRTSSAAVPLNGGGYRDAYPAYGAEDVRAIIDLTPIGIAQFDIQGRFTFVNQHLCRILDYSREDLLQLSYQDITPADDLQACVAALEQLAAGALAEYRADKQFRRPDGSHVWARVNVTAVHDAASGTAAFFVATAEELRDGEVSEPARAMERLLSLEHEARSRAERATRMRDEVLAVVAHDLRNPLHTILLATTSLLEPDIPAPFRQRQVDVIRQVVGSMDRLIGDLLDIARMDTGTFPIQKAPVSVGDLLDELAVMFGPQAEARRITLLHEQETALGVVACDRDELMRVLANLVANAIKFTPEEGRVIVRASRDDVLRLCVQDTGPGIPPEDAPYVFDRFWQADRDAPDGVGLGLMIAKGIVEAHGGTIRVESSPGAGTSFHIELPIDDV